MQVTHGPFNEKGEPITAQNMIFSVTSYLELRNVMIVYCASHFVPIMVELDTIEH